MSQKQPDPEDQYVPSARSFRQMSGKAVGVYPTPWPVINWDSPMLKRFKVVITKANEAKAETIMFDGNEFDVTYALYLIEYLETKIKP